MPEQQIDRSLLDMNCDVPEPTSVQPGEYGLELTKLSLKLSKEGNLMLSAFFTVDDHPDAKLISEYFVLPTSNADPQQIYNRKLALKRLATQIGLDVNSLMQWVATAQVGDAFKEVAGMKVRAILKESSDEQYGTQNNIARWL